MGEKKGDNLYREIIAFHRVKEAGMEEFMKNLLYQFEQSSKKIENKEGIGKDECPNGHSFETNFNPSYFFYFTDTKCLIPVHLFFYSFNLIFESFLHNFNNSKTHHNNYKNQK